MRKVSLVFTMVVLLLFSSCDGISNDNHGGDINDDTNNETSISSSQNNRPNNSAGNQPDDVVSNMQVEYYAIDRNDCWQTYQSSEIADDGKRVDYYRLGKLYNVPIYSTAASKYYGSEVGELSLAIEKANISSQSISNAIERSRSESTSTAHTGGVNCEIEVVENIKVGGSYTYTSEKASEISVSKTEEVAREWTEENRSSCQYTINGDLPLGFYRLTLFGTCEVYAVVVCDGNICYYEYFVIVSSDKNSMYTGLEYSQDGFSFGLKCGKKLSLDVSQLKDIDSNDDMNLGNGLNKSSIIPMDRYGCRDGSKYDKSKPDSSVDYHHDAFDNLVELKLNGCVKDGNKYRVDNAESFSLTLELLHDPDKLPGTGRHGSEYRTIKLFHDTAEKVVQTGIDESEVGEGACWIYITFADGSTESVNPWINLLNGGVVGQKYTLLAPNSADGKKIANIRVVFVYELIVEIERDWLGSLNDDDEYSNWRCEASIDLEY